MKLSTTTAIIVLAISLPAIARPLETPAQSENRLIRRIPTKPSEGGISADLPWLKKRADRMGGSSQPGPSDFYSGPNIIDSDEEIPVSHVDLAHQLNIAIGHRDEELQKAPGDRDEVAIQAARMKVLRLYRKYVPAHTSAWEHELAQAHKDLADKTEAAEKSPGDETLKAKLKKAKEYEAEVKKRHKSAARGEDSFKKFVFPQG